MKLQTFLFQALRVPRKLRLPDFKTIAHEVGKVYQPYAPAAFTPLP
jgi:hypothetical protein